MAKKLTVNMVAMGNLKNRKKHYIGLVTGILLAMIFICGIPFFESCIETSRQEYRYRNLGKQTEMVLDAQNVDMEKVVNSGSLIEKPGYIHISSCIWTENPENSVCVGWMDQQAEKLYYLQMKEGRMPENPDEIALEESALRKLAPNAKPGDVFEVSVGREDAPSTKAYKLVGILQNRKFFLERFGQDLKKLPSAYIAEPDVPAAEEPLIALLNAYIKEYVDGEKTVYDYCESEKIVPTFLDAFGLDGMERGTATIRLSTQQNAGGTFLPGNCRRILWRSETAQTADWNAPCSGRNQKADCDSLRSGSFAVGCGVCACRCGSGVFFGKAFCFFPGSCVCSRHDDTAEGRFHQLPCSYCVGPDSSGDCCGSDPNAGNSQQ